MWMIFLLCFTLWLPNDVASPSLDSEFLTKINKLRKRGCYCGGERMPGVRPLKYNAKLKRSASLYARQMSRENFFGHIDPRGRDLKYRINRVGYNWKVIGENLGHNQENVDRIIEDWKKSPSHCRMMMDPQMSETAIARYDNYWVQHLGTRK